MGNYEIKYRTKRNYRTYYVMRLLKRFSGYVYLPVDQINGSDVSIPKYVVPNWVKDDEVFVIFSVLASGKSCKYFYHPKLHCWFKDLKEDKFATYFSWL